MQYIPTFIKQFVVFSLERYLKVISFIKERYYLGRLFLLACGLLIMRWLAFFQLLPCSYFYTFCSIFILINLLPFEFAKLVVIKLKRLFSHILLAPYLCHFFLLILYLLLKLRILENSFFFLCFIWSLILILLFGFSSGSLFYLCLRTYLLLTLSFVVFFASSAGKEYIRTIFILKETGLSVNVLNLQHALNLPLYFISISCGIFVIRIDPPLSLDFGWTWKTIFNFLWPWGDRRNLCKWQINIIFLNK